MSESQERKSEISGEEAHDEIYTDIARAKNKGVYFEAATSDIQVLVGRVATDDKHGHYLGFRDSNTKEPYVLIKFDCISFHGFATDIADEDSLGSLDLADILLDAIQQKIIEPPTSL